MASLYEAVELPVVASPGPAGRCAPMQNPKAAELVPDLTVGSLLTAALESFVPESVGRAYHAAVARAYTLGRTPLSNVAWLQRLEASPGCTLVLDRHGLTARGGLLPDDHLFKFMARNGLIRDNRVVWAPEYPLLPIAPQRAAPTTAASEPAAADDALGSAPQTTCAATVLNVYQLANDVCGHKGVVHGGLSSALLDESFGYLLYLLASTAAEAETSSSSSSSTAATGGAATSKALRPELPSAALKAAMTAHLEVDFVRPLLPESVVVCVAQVEKVEGRKVWLRAELLSGAPTTAAPGEAAPVVYARGRALFVTPRH
ncbi:hypothetical protein HYH02_014999 [Chlamydomonas schloesseri]|uniref:Thioesterase domain-containing protein n=1 Tax=Chlamydomonas schloesseri TaxID=2026947 RepID=A0A835SIM7_9CHLO|nr:hypothetical protein HYH02_014999 [Chlamydomonas schloesseri]|eukprot:KAG2425627.1 hypothetical protein HYH02_014999 [Chlamydomonas schloesseri]